MKHGVNTQIVLDILRDEVLGDFRAAGKKMSPDYSMTWMYQGVKKLFPSVRILDPSALKGVYAIKGREYRIKNIAEGDNVVMVELIETYPDPKTKQLYQTPLVLVLEMKKGRIQTGRHYCDPNLSRMSLTKRQLSSAYRNPQRVEVVINELSK